MSIPISPAIIINEHFEPQPQLPSGYNVLVTGFTSSGIASEPYILDNITDFVSLFGEPNADHPEQIYAYDAVKRIVESGANAVFTKIPYGKDDGYEVGSEYSALLFPVIDEKSYTTLPYNVELSGNNITEDEIANSTLLSADPAFIGGVKVGDYILYDDYLLLEQDGLITSGSNSYIQRDYVIDQKAFFEFQEPIRISLTEAEYDKINCGQINWSKEYGTLAGVTGYDPIEFGKSGMIILDSGRSKSVDSNSGYYVSVADNKSGDPSDLYDAVVSIKTTTTSGSDWEKWDLLPKEKYNFDLVTLKGESNGSVSKTISSEASRDVPTPWANAEFSNYINVSLWRLREDVRNGSKLLVPVVIESTTGSVSKNERTITEGGFETSSFITDEIAKGNTRLSVLINSHISEQEFDDNKGKRIREVKMQMSGISNTWVDPEEWSPPEEWDDLMAVGANSLFSMSRYAPKTNTAQYDIGNLPAKLELALCTVDNPDRVEIDLSVEAGLGTIWTTVKSEPDAWIENTPNINSFTFDDTVYLDVKGDLGRSNPEFTEEGKFRTLWSEINDKFLTFTESTRISNGGHHHLHIADPLRQIFVNGVDCKTYSVKTRTRDTGVFADMIYHPSKNLTRLLNTSLVTIDAEWYKVNSNYTANATWVPSSPVLAALFASTPFPWDAAAGVSNGRITGVVDVAIDPVQRDRDLLWKIHHNAIFYDRSTSGFLRFADQTLLMNDNIQLRQNSARRLMVWLEKNLRIELRPFLFEPNNIQTRIRFKNAIEAYLKTLLDNGAIEDYAISLSKNTAAMQQEGTMVADIAIKITGITDRIILNFDLLRLDQPFQEVL